nr:unnamed protein product [Callosobruchus analis]
MENNKESGAQWPRKKEKKVRKEDKIRLAKVKGEKYVNHRGAVVEKLKPETHILSFQPRQSHHSRRKNPNIHYHSTRMFVSEYQINIPYKIYWHTFKNKFNIKFGYPRSDTCAECDTYRQKLNNKSLSEDELQQVNIQKELHLRKAEATFSLRRKYKAKAQAVRGHSYLLNDQDFALIEKKKRKTERVEIPDDWDDLIKKAREKPSHFEIVNMKQDHFFDIKTATGKWFLKTAKPSIQIKNIRQLLVKHGDPTERVRDTYSGYWRSCIVRNKTGLPKEMLLKPLYTDYVKIYPLKMSNLKDLLGYLEKPQKRLFYEKKFQQNEVNQDALTSWVEVDEDDNSSGCEDV